MPALILEKGLLENRCWLGFEYGEEEFPANGRLSRCEQSEQAMG
jgi:hypothetical protein